MIPAGGPHGPERLAAALLAALTAVRLVVAARTPLSPDEAYYWVWSRALAAGYLDHPPMVALWVRAGTALAGPGALGVRLLGPLSAALGSCLLHAAARDLSGDRGIALRAAVLLNATLLFGAGAVTMTPDTPLLFFWTAALWGLGRLEATGRSVWWLVIGGAGGLALCSKYTAILLPAGILLWLLLARDRRRWLAHPMPWAAAGLAAALFAPTLLWNARHHWASLAKQGGRGVVFDPAHGPAHLAELLAGQAALATPLIFALCLYGAFAVTRDAMRHRAPAPLLLVCLNLPGALIFLEHAVGDRVQPNWPAILYPAAVIAAAIATPRLPRAWFAAAASFGAAITAAIYLQAAAAPLALPRRLDPSLRLSAGFTGLAATLHAQALRTQASFVAIDDYGPAALIAALSPGCLRIIGLEPRWALFDLPSGAPWMNGRSGLLLRSTRRREPPAMANWASLAPIATLTRSHNGQLAESYTLYQGIGRPGPQPSALLPCRPGAGRQPPAPPD